MILVEFFSCILVAMIGLSILGHRLLRWGLAGLRQPSVIAGDIPWADLELTWQEEAAIYYEVIGIYDWRTSGE